MIYNVLMGMLNPSLTHSLTHCESMTAAKRLENCIMDVSHWSAANRLKLNADKTELLWVGSQYVRYLHLWVTTARPCSSRQTPSSPAIMFVFSV